MGIAIEMGLTTEKVGPSGPALLDVEELLATRLLVQGNSGSGKSHLLRRILEQSAPHVQQVIIDPEGDFVSLAERYGHVVVDANRSEADLVNIANKVRERRVSAVVNLESLDVDAQMRAAGWFLNALFDAPRDLWYPILIVVDEAQLFAPSASGDAAEDARKLSLGAMTNLMCRGRKRGLCGVIATQRLAKLAKNVAAEASNFLMGRTFLDIDMQRAADLLGIDKNKAEMFRELPRGNFVALGPALSRKPLPLQVGGVETTARGSTPKLTPPPVATTDEDKDDILAPVATLTGRTLVQRPAPPPPPPLDEVMAEVSRERPEPGSDASASVTSSPTPAPSREERITAVRTVLAEVLSDEQALFKTEAEIYQGYQVLWRIRKCPGKAFAIEELRPFLLEARAGIEPELAASEDWAHVEEVAKDIHADDRTAYLLLARAARDKAPCPSDMTIAVAYGFNSPGRVRSRITSLEKGAYIIVKADMRGLRTVVFPDMKWETAPGDPKGPAFNVTQLAEAS